MAKRNPGDILSCDWNPVIGCERFSTACRNCWYLDGIFPWQRRLGNIPRHLESDESHVFDRRLTEAALAGKRGIVGVVQHGDLFWDRVPDAVIERVLAIVDAVAPRRPATKYLLWTKRARRMADTLVRRYPGGLPSYLAAAVSVEDQESADLRLPELARITGTRVAVLEPLLGPVDLRGHLSLEWVILGSETGKAPRPLDPDWARAVRDQVVPAGIPFFIKQLGTSHREQARELDGLSWSEFPEGYIK